MKCIFCENDCQHELLAIAPFGWWCEDCLVKVWEVFRNKKDVIDSMVQKIYRAREVGPWGPDEDNPNLYGP